MKNVMSFVLMFVALFFVVNTDAVASSVYDPGTTSPSLDQYLTLDGLQMSTHAHEYDEGTSVYGTALLDQGFGDKWYFLDSVHSNMQKYDWDSRLVRIYNSFEFLAVNYDPSFESLPQSHVNFGQEINVNLPDFSMNMNAIVLNQVYYVEVPGQDDWEQIWTPNIDLSFSFWSAYAKIICTDMTILSWKDTWDGRSDQYINFTFSAQVRLVGDSPFINSFVDSLPLDSSCPKIPEPATLMLMGLGGLIASRIRRK
jgi:hypothetical protein